MRLRRGTTHAAQHARGPIRAQGTATRPNRTVWLDAEYGKQPKTIACNVTPSDQTSAKRPLYVPLLHTSGAVYVGVPGEPMVVSERLGCTRETPKSEITARPSPAMRMLSGLRS
jgi:hypothetical protein